MTTDRPDTASRVRDALHLEAPWEIYGQRLRRFELYFDGTHVETVRGPITLEGVGIRVFRPRGSSLGVGLHATSDLSPEGLRAAHRFAEANAKAGTFPASQFELPSKAPKVARGPEVCSAPLWESPAEAVEAFVHALLAPLEGVSDVRASFGSVRATLSETSIANSEGLDTSYVATEAELELALAAFGGPEGPPPGEYWVNREMRTLETGPVSSWVTAWAQRARDVRRARPPVSGTMPVAFPPSQLSEILPQAMALRFSGTGRLQRMALATGTAIAPSAITIQRDPTLPWAPGSAPVDDEGALPSPVALVDHGATGELAYDVLHAAAFDRRTNGAAGRLEVFGPHAWYRFVHRPVPLVTPMTVACGPDGTEEELLEGIEEGLWVDQLGWANPDPRAGTFGGELRVGYRIHHGKLAEPVRGGTVGGPVYSTDGSPSLLGGVMRIGSRAELVGRLLAPSLVVKGPVVAGGSPPA
jgi:predicted Zn-dependent protease